MPEETVAYTLFCDDSISQSTKESLAIKVLNQYDLTDYVQFAKTRCMEFDNFVDYVCESASKDLAAAVSFLYDDILPYLQKKYDLHYEEEVRYILS